MATMNNGYHKNPKANYKDKEQIIDGKRVTKFITNGKSNTQHSTNSDREARATLDDKDGSGPPKSKFQFVDTPYINDPTLSAVVRRSRELNELPVDRGWSWVICFAGFMTYFSMGMGGQILQNMFLDILHMHQASITQGSLMFTCGILSLSISSVIVTNFIMPRIGVRACVMIGGLGQSLGSIGYFLSPNIYVMMLCVAFKGGIIGFLFVPSISIIRHYFHVRRSLANTICNVGVCVATIAIPPVIRALRHYYGVRGTCLVVAALELHTVAAGALMRPVEAYLYRPTLAPLQRPGIKGNKQPEENGVKETSRDIQTVKTSLQRAGQSKDITEKLLPYTQAKDKDIEIENGDCLNNDHGDELKEIRSFHVSTVSLASNTEHIVPNAFTETKDNYVVDSNPKKPPSVLSLWSLRLVLLYALPSAANNYIRNYIPTIAKTQGVTLDQGSYILTIVGVVDLCNRLSLGWLADKHILKPSQIIVINLILLGIVSQFLRFFTTFPLLILMGVLLGLLIGVGMCMRPLLAIEVAGVERMPQTFSFMSTMTTLSSAAMNPLFGHVVEVTGDFVVVLHIVGGLVTVAALILMALPLAKRVDQREMDRRNATS